MTDLRLLGLRLQATAVGSLPLAYYLVTMTYTPMTNKTNKQPMTIQKVPSSIPLPPRVDRPAANHTRGAEEVSRVSVCVTLFKKTAVLIILRESNFCLMSEATHLYNLPPAEALRPGDDLTKQGAKFDYGKIRWSLVPWDSVRAILNILGLELKSMRPAIGSRVWIGADHLMGVFGTLQHGGTEKAKTPTPATPTCGTLAATSSF